MKNDRSCFFKKVKINFTIGLKDFSQFKICTFSAFLYFDLENSKIDICYVFYFILSL